MFGAPCMVKLRVILIFEMPEGSILNNEKKKSGFWGETAIYQCSGHVNYLALLLYVLRQTNGVNVKHESQKHIILLEPDRAFRNSLARVLIKRGYDILMVTDYNEALEYLKKRKTDIFILGLDKPEQKRLSELHSIMDDFPDVPVILISSFDVSELQKRLEARPTLHILSKPVKKDYLIKTLDRLTIVQS